MTDIPPRRSRVPASQPQPTIGLVLSGGGARGAYQIGVLKAVAEIWGPRHPTPFKVITGLSVGAINAAGLACNAHNFRQATTSLERLWLSLTCDSVYKTGFAPLTTRLLHWAASFLFSGLGVKNPRALLDNSPLQDLLSREMDLSALTRCLDDGLLDALAISAASYQNGQAVTFYDSRRSVRAWERSRREGRARILTLKHIMASTALPFLFPAVRINQAYYGDGALRQTSPFSPAIHLGADKIFAIGGRDGEIDAEENPGTPTYPGTGEVAGHLLDILFNDNLDMDLERLQRINKTLEKLDAGQRDVLALRPIETFMLRPSIDIRQITARHVDSLPWTIKALIRGLGGWKAPFLLPSYLMFERGFIRELIELGYQDALDQKAAITAFLGSPPRNSRPQRANASEVTPVHPMAGF
ncbi:patatin-like phospholipase family protein [Rhodovibrionaceae bacterium A322]